MRGRIGSNEGGTNLHVGGLKDSMVLISLDNKLKFSCFDATFTFTLFDITFVLKLFHAMFTGKKFISKTTRFSIETTL